MIGRPAEAFLDRSFRFWRSAHGSSMGTAPKVTLFLLLAALALPAPLASQSITVTVAGSDPNDWYVGSFDSSDIGDPGTDFSVTTHPAAPVIQTVDINVLGYPPGQWVRVLISKADDAATTWNSQYEVQVNIVDGGSGTGSFEATITGWTPVTTSETQMFRVRRDRTGITVQLELRNKVVAGGTRSGTPSMLTTVTYTARRP